MSSPEMSKDLNSSPRSDTQLVVEDQHPLRGAASDKGSCTRFTSADMDIDGDGGLSSDGNFADEESNDGEPALSEVSTSFPAHPRSRFSSPALQSRYTSHSALPAGPETSIGRSTSRSLLNKLSVSKQSTGRQNSRSTMAKSAASDPVGHSLSRSPLSQLDDEDTPVDSRTRSSHRRKKYPLMAKNMIDDDEDLADQDMSIDYNTRPSHPRKQDLMMRNASDDDGDLADQDMPVDYNTRPSHPRKHGTRSMFGNVYADSEESNRDENETKETLNNRRSTFVQYSDDEPDVDDDPCFRSTNAIPSDTRNTSRAESSKPRPTKGMQHPARHTRSTQGFSVPDVLRRPVRGSDSRVVLSRNKIPDCISTESVAEARRMQYGGPRAMHTAAKRALGANDPENILIVNLKENENMRWEEIANTLNNNRIATGRKPDLTANSVHNRYNRNAPILFAAEGKEFVPIKERRGGYKTTSKWTPALDRELLEAVRQQEENKWFAIARLFTERTGQEIDPKTAAYRHSLI